MFDETEDHDHVHTQNRFAVIPTPEKLNADSQFTGKGIRIAFLDSGFFPHPDIHDRIVTFYDVSGGQDELHQHLESQSFQWHGTQTTVSCAGNGKLCDGIYRGIASEAELVLVRVSDQTGAIPDQNIELGLQWILDNREKYNIRVLNMSLGGDANLPSAESKIDQLAEECVKQGIVVIVAAGNSADNVPIPPANSPSVITVGGYSDENQFDEADFELYHSSYGVTADGTIKPEVIAPAMFVAAPILPKTADYIAAETLAHLLTQPDYKLKKAVLEHWEKADLPEEILSLQNVSDIREAIENEIQDRKIIATHYQYVDGTSFAAPITASVVAQMLEANPKLTPFAVKDLLISTAQRLMHFPAIRQGFGVVHAQRALAEAQKETHVFAYENYMPPRIDGEMISFFYHNDEAVSVNLAGDFNNWNESSTPFAKDADGIWMAKIPALNSGKYRYKFVVNQTNWLEDPSNGLKEEDGFGGFNSILHII